MLAPKLKERIWLQLWGLKVEGQFPSTVGKSRSQSGIPLGGHQASWGVKMMGSWSVKRSNLVWLWTGSLFKWSVWKYPIYWHICGPKKLLPEFLALVFGIEELTLKDFERFKQTGSSQRTSNFNRIAVFQLPAQRRSNLRNNATALVFYGKVLWRKLFGSHFWKENRIGFHSISSNHHL